MDDLKNEIKETLDYLVRYGMISTITNIEYPAGSHQYFLKKAMNLISKIDTL